MPVLAILKINLLTSFYNTIRKPRTGSPHGSVDEGRLELGLSRLDRDCEWIRLTTEDSGDTFTMAQGPYRTNILHSNICKQ